jgi:hypothetical protein
MDSMTDTFKDFDKFCTQNNIQQEELGQAFAAFLNRKTGWDGKGEKMTDCTHIVGYRHGMNDALLIHSDEARDLEPSTFFTYCPKCGVKL